MDFVCKGISTWQHNAYCMVHNDYYKEKCFLKASIILIHYHKMQFSILGITTENPEGTNWKQLSGKAKQCSVEGSAATIWCVNTAEDVSKYQPGNK